MARVPLLEETDGWTDWVRPHENRFRLGCCDCGLMHDVEFRARKSQVEFRLSRNRRATAAKRREEKKRAK